MISAVELGEVAAAVANMVDRPDLADSLALIYAVELELDKRRLAIYKQAEETPAPPDELRKPSDS